MRRAAAASALILVISTIANPSTEPPALAAATTAPQPLATAVHDLHSERAERAAAPPASRLGRTVGAHAAGARTKALRPPVKVSPARRAAAVRLARAGAVLDFARDQIGDPYRWGASGPGSWDCSGLTKGAFAAARIALPRRAASQSARGVAVSRRAARVGDLALWGGVGSAYHVGIYLGGGWVLHSPRAGYRVKVAPLWGRPQFRRLF